MIDEARAGVLGAGTMGAGIAEALACAGYRIVLVDQDRALVEQGILRVRENLDRAVARGKLSAADRDAAVPRLQVGEQLEDLAGCLLVIEAVPEELSLKQAIFQRLGQICPREALLATNTSSLSISRIAEGVKNPARVLGMHFFNPVHRMPLLELVRGAQTSDEALARARQVAEALGKQIVEVKDAPGFATTRLGVALGMEAIRMVEQGVARPEDIDRAMELGYGHPMGPLKLTDWVGLDVRLAIAEHLSRELAQPAFRPPELLKEMVRAGKLGRKSGQGFYSYSGPTTTK